MKGQRFHFNFQEIEHPGISPRVLRLTDENYTCNHLYFHNRSFTPDDSRVLFQSTLDGGFNLFSLILESGEVIQLTEKRNLDYFCQASRDGREVYFGADGCIWAVNLDSLDERLILDANKLLNMPVNKCSGAFPSWDGSRLVCFFEADPEFGLILKDLRTGEERVLLRGAQHVRHCQFCPSDPDLILYAHEGNWATIQARMWLYNLKTGENCRLRDHDEGTAEQVGHEFWANHSRKVYFTMRGDGDIRVAVYDVDSDTEQVLMHLNNVHGTLTQDDAYFISDSRPSQGEMYIVKLATLEKRLLCHHNMSWIKGMSRYHPHVTVSHSTNQAIFTSDGFGKNPGVFLADIPAW